MLWTADSLANTEVTSESGINYDHTKTVTFFSIPIVFMNRV